MSESLDDLAEKLQQLELQITEHDARLDLVETASKERSQANRELIQKRFAQIKQGSGIAIALVGFIIAIYVSWSSLDKESRSQVSSDFFKAAIPVLLAAGGGALVLTKR